MAAVRTRRKSRRSKPRRRTSKTAVHLTAVHMESETDFIGPNIRKRHRKPDELYGASIPDHARKE